MKTALVTAIGSAAAPAVIASLKRAGFRAAGCDIYPREWLVTAGEVDAFAQTPRGDAGEAFLAALLALCRAQGAELLVPLTDVEVDALSGAADQFERAGVTLCMPQPAVARLCRDKRALTEALRAANVCDTIPTREAARCDPDAMTYPALLKPNNGRSSEGKVIVGDAAAFRAAVRARGDLIAQPFLPGTVFTVDALRDGAGRVFCAAREELQRTANGLGTVVRTLPGHPLEQTAGRIADLLDLRGAVNVEFIQHEGTYYFLEVNPRFSGGVGFTCLAGYDLPAAAARVCRGEPLPAGAIRAATMAQRYEQRVLAEDSRG